MKTDSRILVLGASGMVGRAITRRLEDLGYTHILTPSRTMLPLQDQRAVSAYFQQHQPEYVFMAAAKVGGIMANATEPADFILQNLLIESHVFAAAHNYHVKRMLFMGSSCVYPREAGRFNPITEDQLMTRPLESTNSAYAIAKIAGIEMCRAFRQQYASDFFAVMPTNLYGPNDTYGPGAHVIPALMQKIHNAHAIGDPTARLLGTGRAVREFMHVSDLARYCVKLMELQKEVPRLVNIGTGESISIVDLARMIAGIVGFTGEIEFTQNESLDGTPRKDLNHSLLCDTLGEEYPTFIRLRQGLQETYEQVKGIL